MIVYEICDQWDGERVTTFESQEEADKFMYENGHNYVIHEINVYKTYEDYRNEEIR